MYLTIAISYAPTSSELSCKGLKLYFAYFRHFGGTKWPQTFKLATVPPQRQIIFTIWVSMYLTIAISYAPTPSELSCKGLKLYFAYFRHFGGTKWPQTMQTSRCTTLATDYIYYMGVHVPNNTKQICTHP